MGPSLEFFSKKIFCCNLSFRWLSTFQLIAFSLSRLTRWRSSFKTANSKGTAESKDDHFQASSEQSLWVCLLPPLCPYFCVFVDKHTAVTAETKGAVLSSTADQRKKQWRRNCNVLMAAQTSFVYIAASFYVSWMYIIIFSSATICAIQ